MFADTILSIENIDTFIGALRSENKRVYFKPSYWTYPDILLYDFGAEVGDTVWHNASFIYGSDIEPGIHYSVIETISMDNNRKIYWTKPSSPIIYSTVWYEGIGSYNGLLFSLVSNMPMYLSPEDFELNCFKHNNEVQYLNNYPCNCFCSGQSGISNNKLNINSIKIFPNPAKDIILYINNSDNLDINCISLINYQGQIIKQYEPNINQINVYDIPAGIYFIKFSIDREDIIQKIMIEK